MLPVFNVADCAILAGVGILVWHLGRVERGADDGGWQHTDVPGAEGGTGGAA
jgi:hypothetical protein